MTTDLKTRSQNIAGDVAALFRSRQPLTWITTREEARVEGYLFAAAKAAKLIPYTWDIAAGVQDENGAPAGLGDTDPGAMLSIIKERAENTEAPESNLWIMRDLPIWFSDRSGPGGATLLRQLRNLVRVLPNIENSTHTICIISPSADVPAELANHARVIDWPMPDRAELGAILDEAMAVVGDKAEPLNGKRDAAIDAVVGLSGEDAQATFALSLVKLKRIDPIMAAKEKKAVISREKLLEWYDPLPGGLEAVGGLEALKAWLLARRAAYTPQARAYGLPAPKGVLLVGIPGCGKSLTAKAIATAFGCPLIKMDMGALKSKFVGESEQNLRKAFAIIEAIGRCVVWLDELEKALAGASDGSADGGVSSDALGAILNWMQERAGEAFVVATANNVTTLPPELLRKGRFDELFFVDMPNSAERVAVLAAALEAHKLDPKTINLDVVAGACENFTGSEIASLVPEAMFAAFNDGAREVEDGDLICAAELIVPLSKTAAPKIEALRKWAKDNARPATIQTATVAQLKRGRAIEI